MKPDPGITLVAAPRTPHEHEYVARAIESRQLRAGGPFARACEALLVSEVTTPRAFLTSSCTAALHLAGQALALGPGDEIIVPSYAFASCASVFASLGATVVFADSRSDAPHIDETRIEPLLTARTRAVLAIHYA